MQHKKDWLIIANGEPLSTDILFPLAKNKSIMMLDGACSAALITKIQPDVVLGDFDSIDMNIKNILAKTSLFVHVPDQNSTDLEKGLLYLTDIGSDSVTIVNASGWRMDHTLYNLRLLKRFHDKFRVLMIMTEREKIYYIHDQKVELQGEEGQAVSMLSYPEAVVSSVGLQYEMDHLRLKFGVRESTSNALVKKNSRIEIAGEVLMLIDHNIDIRRVD